MDWLQVTPKLSLFSSPEQEAKGKCEEKNWGGERGWRGAKQTNHIVGQIYLECNKQRKIAITNMVWKVGTSR